MSYCWCHQGAQVLNILSIKVLSETTCKNVFIYFQADGGDVLTPMCAMFSKPLCWTVPFCYKFKCLLGDPLSTATCIQAIHLSAGVGIRTHDLYAANGVQRLYLCSFLSVYVQHHVKAVLYFGLMGAPGGCLGLDYSPSSLV